MNRRTFFQRLGAAAIGLTLARHLPGIAPQAPTLAALPEVVEDAKLGIRFIKDYDITKHVWATRIDLMYPPGIEGLSARILSA